MIYFRIFLKIFPTLSGLSRHRRHIGQTQKEIYKNQGQVLISELWQSHLRKLTSLIFRILLECLQDVWNWYIFPCRKWAKCFCSDLHQGHHSLTI